MAAVTFAAAVSSRCGTFAPRGPSADSTASAPVTVSATAPGSVASPSMTMIPGRRGTAAAVRASTCTGCPASTAQASSRPPIPPVAPRMASRGGLPRWYPPAWAAVMTSLLPRRRGGRGAATGRPGAAGRCPAPAGSSSMSRKLRPNTPTWNHRIRCTEAAKSSRTAAPPARASTGCAAPGSARGRLAVRQAAGVTVGSAATSRACRQPRNWVTMGLVLAGRDSRRHQAGAQLRGDGGRGRPRTGCRAARKRSRR